MRFLLLLTIMVAAASALPRVHIETSLAQELPARWTRVRNMVRSLALEREVIIAIKQQNTDKLEQMFWDVSNPQSENYGKYLTLDELTDLIAPSEESLNTVTEWLASHGVTQYRLTRNRDFLHVDLTLGQIAEMLSLEFDTYLHATGQMFIGTLGPYSVPAHVAPHVDLIANVIGLPDWEERMPRKRLGPEGGLGAGLDITPDVLRARYNVSSSVVPKAKGNSAAVVEFQYQFYSTADLTTFFQRFVPAHQQCDKVTNVYGKNIQNQPGTEASLDVQYLMGVAPCLATVDYYSAYQFNFWNDLTQWISFVSNQSQPALVQSVSYGSQGQYPTADYQTRQDQEYQKMGVRGISVVYASGDSGAQCVGTCTALDPSYPAISPYVTSVGSTAFINGNAGPEKATSAFKSGGGFAFIQTQPAYQKTVVPAYLKQNIQFPPTKAFNGSNRGTPDFAALGDVHFQVIVGGRQFSIGGTSASAPTFSAIISLLNDLRLQNGKPSLGFLNTFLYQTAASNKNAFFDVTMGDNKKGCLPNLCAPDLDGFLCSPGWDPVTGNGTPNYQVLAQLV